MIAWLFIIAGLAVSLVGWMKFRRVASSIPGLFFLTFLPRLGFLFAQNGHGDADPTVEIVRAWFASGVYRQRWPGAPVYDVILGLLDKAATAAGVPYFYFTNVFSALCVVATLACLLRLFRPLLGESKALAAVLLFNFYPQELVIGAATYELSLLMALLAGAWLAYARSRPNIALFLAVLAIGAKLSALAMVIPLAALMSANDARERRVGRAFLRVAAVGLGAALIFLPRLMATERPQEFFAPFFGAPVYHANIPRFTRYGAFLLRTGNLLGPVGVPLVAALLAWRFRRLAPFAREGIILIAAYSIILIYLMFSAPWEAYYLLPLVPLAYFLVFWLDPPRVVVALFVMSVLLPLVVQVQAKPWKFPPWDIRQGVISAHMHRSFVDRGGG